MRLPDFIVTEREQILSEWDEFARSCLGSDGMSLDALRDHAGEILAAIAKDLKTPQSELQRAQKSEGDADAKEGSGSADTAAQAHGEERAHSGFDLKTMVSEYRALRASVIRLWVAHSGQLGAEDIDDLMRFNEAIDQALAESLARYGENIDYAKEMFVGMLGHDLRTPLGAIMSSAAALTHAKATLETAARAASIILSSGRRMNALVNDLLDFARSRLGDGIPVVRKAMDLGQTCRETVEEIAATHPTREIQLRATGNLSGKWDEARVSQALSNLIGNAVQHGSAGTSIHVNVSGEADEAVLSVRSLGPTIPEDQWRKIFDPMHRGVGEQSASGLNIGLGLYICERIVAAHGGTISVHSSEENGTTFTIRLPRADAQGGSLLSS